MSWNLNVVSVGEKPLGIRSDVVARISAAFPAIQWQEGPSSFDELTSIPDHPLLNAPWPPEKLFIP